MMKMSKTTVDSSNDKRKQYTSFVCGFNGYNQLSHLEVENNENYSIKTVSVAVPVPFFSSTVEIEPVMTFSNFYNISESGEIECHGFCSTKLNDDLKQQKLKIQQLLRIGSSDVILRSQKDFYISSPDKGVHKVTCNPSVVDVKASTSEEVYGIANGKLHRAALSNLDQDGYHLDFSPLLTQIMVAKVSCGVEHTLILTVPGDVMACGKGSRGQLGQGTCSVDIMTTPAHVTTLEGIEIIDVAAGGWHSVAVSACGDAYVWGWNLHGQLGLPCPELEKTDINQPTNPSSTKQVLCKCFHVSSEGEKPVKRGEVSFGDLGETKTVNQIEFESHKTYSSCEKCGGLKACDSGRIGGETDLTSVLTVKEQGHGDETVLGGLRVLQGVLKQDNPVHVQMEPYGLEFPESFHVTMVSCGTRHTCVVLASGELLTSGWNQYGQLCHGDTHSRDYFQTVDYFVQKQEVVEYVKAEAWNTYIRTNKKEHR